VIPPGWRDPGTTVYRRNLAVPKAVIEGASIKTKFISAFAHVPEAYEWEATQVRIVGTDYFARFQTKRYIIPLAALLNVQISFEAANAYIVLITDEGDEIVDDAGDKIIIGR